MDDLIKEGKAMEDHIPSVQILIAVLHNPKNPESLQECFLQLEACFSSIEFQSKDYPFAESNYYEEEMGDQLSRRIISFTNLVAPDFLAEAKHQCRKLEANFSTADKRSINLDVGYMDQHKVVLASFKEMRNKIYLSKGVWADWSLQYEKGHFNPMPWCFADFKSGIYEKDLLRIREGYKKKLKKKGAKKTTE